MWCLLSSLPAPQPPPAPPAPAPPPSGPPPSHPLTSARPGGQAGVWVGDWAEEGWEPEAGAEAHLPQHLQGECKHNGGAGVVGDFPGKKKRIVRESHKPLAAFIKQPNNGIRQRKFSLKNNGEFDICVYKVFPLQFTTPSKYKMVHQEFIVDFNIFLERTISSLHNISFLSGRLS